MDNEKKNNILRQHPDVPSGSGKNNIPLTNPVGNAGVDGAQRGRRWTITALLLALVVAVVIIIALLANQPSTAEAPVEEEPAPEVIAPDTMEAAPEVLEEPVSEALQFSTFNYTYHFVCDGLPEYTHDEPVRVDYPVSGPEPFLTACRVAIAAQYGDADQAGDTPDDFVQTWINKKEDTSQNCKLEYDTDNYVTFEVYGESLSGGNAMFDTPFTLDKGTGRTLEWTDIIPFDSRNAFMEALAADLPYVESDPSRPLPDFDDEHMWGLFDTPVCLTPQGVVFYNNWAFGCHADCCTYLIPYAVAAPHMSGYAQRLAGL